MADYVASQTIILDDQLSAGSDAAEASLTRLANAADAAAASTDNAAASVTKAGPSATALARQADTATGSLANLAAAQAKLASVTATMAAGVAAGSVTVDDQTAVLAKWQAAVDKAQASVASFAAANTAAAAQIDSLSESTDNLSTATAQTTTLQQRLNEAFGLANGQPDTYAARAADIAAYGNAMDATRAKFNPIFAVSKQYESTLEEISAAEANGALSTNEAAAARDNATAAFSKAASVGGDLTNSVNATSAAHAGLYREIVILGHEVVSGNYARIPGSMMVLAERSGQLESIFSAVGTAFTTASGLMIVGAAAGVVAIGALIYSANAYEQKQIDLQNSIRATKDNYADLTTEALNAGRAASQATPGLSNTDAVAAAGTLAASPEFSGTTAQLTSLTELAANMGAVFKETAEKAATDLAAAMDDPGQAADRLVGHLKGMTQALADSIVQMEATGDKAGAFAIYEGVMANAVDGASASLTPLGQALRDIESAFNESGTASGRFGESLGGALVHGAAIALEAIAKVLSGLKELRDWDAQYLPWADGYGQSTAGGTGGGSGSVTDTINSVGATLGASPAVVNLAQRIAPVESSTGQFTASGAVVTNTASGALGAMQVLPMNAGNNDLNTLQGNVTAAETLLIRLYGKYGGNETLVTMAYNWGEGNVDKMLASGGTAPASVAQYAANVASGSAGSLGVTNPETNVTNQALAASSGSLESQADALTAKIALLKQGLINLAANGVNPNSSEFYRLTTELNATTLAYSNLADPAAKLGIQLDTQLDSQNDLTAAYGQGYAAVQETTAANTAYGEAVATVGTKSDAFGAVLDVLTAKHVALAQATAATGIAQQTLTNGDSLAYLQAETSSIGENGVARDAMLARLKAEQELREKNIPEISAEGQAYLASVDAISAQTSALQKSQQTMSDLENLATSSFDTISSAITNAFAEGGKSAIDFGSVARTVFSQVIADVAKIGVLNPILNNLFGGNRTTLSDVSGLLGGLSGQVDTGATDGTVQIAGTNLSGGLSPTTGTMSAAASPGGVSGFFGTPTIGTGTIGSTIGGVAGGIGIGSTLNNLIGGNSTGGEVGSAVGAAAGAAIGSVVPVIGTLIGGLIGGAGGGLLGGLFGNSKPSDMTMKAQENITTGATTTLGESSGKEYSATNLSAAQNLASVTETAAQSLASAFNLDLPNVNVNAKVGSRDGDTLRIGSGATYSTPDDSTSSASSLVNQAITGLVGTIGGTLDATTKAILKGIDYSSSSAAQEVSSLAAALTNGKLDATQTAALPKLSTSNSADTISELGWIKNTYEPTINSASDMGSIATQVAAVNTSFTDLIAHAQRLGLATDGLTTAQSTQTAAIMPAANDTISASGSTISAAYQKQTGSSVQSQLTDFDAAAKQQQAALVTEFQGLFGDAYASQHDYVVQTTELTATIAAQRADLITSAQQALEATVAGSSATVVSAYQKENGDSSDAALTTFDASAATQKQALATEFQGLFGDAYKSQADYVYQSGLLVETLAEQRQDLITSQAAADLATQHTTNAAWVSNVAAGWKAQATIDGLQGTASGNAEAATLNENADLANFDASAKTAIDAASAQLINAYGQGYASSAGYANQMVDLESSLAEQRLAIQAQYAAQAKAAQTAAESSATSVVTSLASYVETLQTGTASALSPQSQYALAKSQYQAVSGSAAAGNVTSLGEVQSYATAFLAASQNVNGSGGNYAYDFSTVLSTLQAIAAIPQNTLTASFMAAALQDQTTTLSANDAALLAEVKALRMEMQQQNARAAA